MAGKRLSGFEKPRSWRTRFIRSARVLAVVDGEGRIEADLLGVLAQQPRADAVEGARPRRAHRSRRRPCAQHLRRRCARRAGVISAAARREKVISRMRRGSAPLTIRCATRCASVLVLPEPAPAMTSSGPPRAVGAADAMLDGAALRAVQFLEVRQSHQGPAVAPSFVGRSGRSCGIDARIDLPCRIRTFSERIIGEPSREARA